jgi:hypothetical protein
MSDRETAVSIKFGLGIEDNVMPTLMVLLYREYYNSLYKPMLSHLAAAAASPPFTE